ncbi:MAG: hydroxyisourate hydrolase [Hyphomicrobiales bacterium]|nr:hydroxyisourate hydrolase [Hyphomicrobiales bacterium]
MTGSAGFLTTHILDTANGVPAAGVEIELYTLSGGGREKIAATRTNADGRTDTPLLGKGAMPAGGYEIVFMIGDYFAARGTPGAKEFLDIVPIRFVISDANSHYHVPLLASPFSFSTYRGS